MGRKFEPQVPLISMVVALLAFLGGSFAALPETEIASYEEFNYWVDFKEYWYQINSVVNYEAVQEGIANQAIFDSNCSSVTSCYSCSNSSLTDPSSCTMCAEGGCFWQQDDNSICCNDGSVECGKNDDDDDITCIDDDCEDLPEILRYCTTTYRPEAFSGQGLAVCGTSGGGECGSCQVNGLPANEDGEESCDNSPEGTWVVSNEYQNDYLGCLGILQCYECSIGQGGYDGLSCAQNGGTWFLNASATSEDDCDGIYMFQNSFEEGETESDFGDANGVMLNGTECAIGPGLIFTDFCVDPALMFADFEADVDAETAYYTSQDDYTEIFSLSEYFNHPVVALADAATVKPVLRFTNSVCFITIMQANNEGFIEFELDNVEGHAVIIDARNQVGAEAIRFLSGRATVLGAVNYGSIEVLTESAVRLIGISNYGNVFFNNSDDTVIANVESWGNITFGSNTAAVFVDVENHGVVNVWGGDYTVWNLLNTGEINIYAGNVGGFVAGNSGVATFHDGTTGTISVNASAAGTIVVESGSTVEIILVGDVDTTTSTVDTTTSTVDTTTVNGTTTVVTTTTSGTSRVHVAVAFIVIVLAFLGL